MTQIRPGVKIGDNGLEFQSLIPNNPFTLGRNPITSHTDQYSSDAPPQAADAGFQPQVRSPYAKPEFKG